MTQRFTLNRRHSLPRRLATFMVLLAIAWLPFAAVAYWLLPDDNQRTIVMMGTLAIEFIVLVRLWGWTMHGYPRPLEHYGLGLSVANRVNLLYGLLLGTLSIAAMYGLETLFGWVTWRSPSLELWRIIAEGLLVSVGVALAEELVFRGWLLDELEHDFSPAIALWVNSITFAILHYLKPLDEVIRTLPGLPGLILLGLLLVWAKRATWMWAGLKRRGQLGLPIGIHAGLVWGSYTLHVGEWVNYSDRVPSWLTGIDNNPIAGVMGITFLGLLAAIFWWRSRL